MHETAEVVIIGAGVNGASVAYHLALAGVKRIIVLEKQVAAAGASGLSSGLVRMHYTNEIEARLALSSYTYFRHWDEFVGGDCGFVETGFIRTVAPRNYAKLRTNVAMLQSIGVDTRLISGTELQELTPGIVSDDLLFAAYEPHAGYADASATTFTLLDAARGRGVMLRQGVEVLGLRLDGERVTGVSTASGEIEAGVTVCTAGGWTMQLLAPLGLHFPVWNARQQVAMLRRPPGQQAHMTYIDGVLDAYYRPDSPGMTLVSSGPMESVADPEHFDHNTDAHFIEAVAEKISLRMPAMAHAAFVRGWAGSFAVSADLHPLIGPLPAYEQIYAAFGCNGSGFKIAPAVGKALAEYVLGVSKPGIPLHTLRPVRYFEDAAIVDPYSYADRPQEHTAPPN